MQRRPGPARRPGRRAPRVAPGVEQDEVEPLRPVACAHSGPERGVRVPTAPRSRSGAAAAGTPRGRGSADAFFDPHHRDQRLGERRAHAPVALRLDDEDRARVGGGEVRPEIATRARRNASRRWSRAASASSAGSSERFGRPSRSRKRSRISTRFLWIAGTSRCDGRSPASWTISSARSVSIGRDACGFERLVEPDLVGCERLHLDDLVGALGLRRARRRSRSPRLRRAPSGRRRPPPDGRLQLDQHLVEARASRP